MQEKKIYPEEETKNALISLLSEKTYMVDYAIEIYSELYKKPSEVLEKKKTELISKLSEVKNKCHKFLSFTKDQIQELITQNSFNFAYLEEQFEITTEDVDAIYHFAKFEYECGKYDTAIDNLNAFRALNSDLKKDKSALWGKLSSEILMSKWDEAESDIYSLKEIIEDQGVSQNPLQQLQYRLWLIHWSLFVYFHEEKTENGTVSSRNLVGFLDFLLGNERYLRAIEIKAPWILRYLTIASILTKHRLTDLVRIVKQEYGNTSALGITEKTALPLTCPYDPVIHFVWCLYVKFDFDGAEKELEKCEEVLIGDYFVKENTTKEFIKNARFVLCEAYCKIHSTIDIEMMSKKLKLSTQESESWIVNLIRASKLDAKIDSSKNTVIVSSQEPSVYKLLLEKTKTLSSRAETQASNLERYKTQVQKEEKISAPTNEES